MDYDHVKKQLGYGIQTESKDNAIKAIEQLTARVRELEEEIERLRADNIAFARNLKGKSATTGATYEHICTQLAAAQLDNQRLRSELASRARHWMECKGGEDDCLCGLSNALSQPTSTEALDAYVAEKVKEYAIKESEK